MSGGTAQDEGDEGRFGDPDIPPERGPEAHPATPTASAPLEVPTGLRLRDLALVERQADGTVRTYEYRIEVRRGLGTGGPLRRLLATSLFSDHSAGEDVHAIRFAERKDGTFEAECPLVDFGPEPPENTYGDITLFCRATPRSVACSSPGASPRTSSWQERVGPVERRHGLPRSRRFRNNH